MLLELQITDFAIIERLHLRLAEGFNVLTGETGAGKSIIIDALGSLRGEKTDVSFVRAGSSRSRVEGVFSLNDCPDLQPVLEEYGLWEDDSDQIILTREISADSGRSVARVNGRAVSASVLREVGSRLVDIHGQHEGLSLFNPRTHLDMLDRYGDLLALREQVAGLVAEVRRVREELADLRRSEARRVERIEELRFLLEDVAAAQLRPGEEESLAHERSLLQNSVRITELANSSYSALAHGGEGERSASRPATEVLARVAEQLAELARLDSDVAPLAEHATELRYQLDELAVSLRAYRDKLDFDPARLDEIEDRLTVIHEMQRKYGADIEAILARAARAESEIERLANSAEHMAELEMRETKLLAELSQVAGELSRRRRDTGLELAQAIEGAMGDLAMRNVRFAVSMEFEDDAKGVPLADSKTPRRVAFDKTGIDRVEFLISPNPGEPLKPLAKIASGGESARLLLALKSILSRVDTVSTLVFDEIDVGVGGRAGQVVGQKLWAMTENHQVICITHLPQVAAFADAHYHIAKQFSADRTRTSINQLDEEARVNELASMLDGSPSEHSRANAREIVTRALTFKHHYVNQAPNGLSQRQSQQSDQHQTIAQPVGR
ncbi:MAG: DNA repair protein RecN [Chloroflexaceae bacterium]|jgi:DNA repair protein RecN (Recombination protein N)|nr:DNA repair protein RecN [Chloroflexaceae bacterium]